MRTRSRGGLPAYLFLALTATSAAPQVAPDATGVLTFVDSDEPQQKIVHKGKIAALRNVKSSKVLGDQPGVEIELSSDGKFPVRNELAILQIGEMQFDLSRYPDDGSTSTLIFTLTAEEFAKTVNGDPVTVQYGREEAYEIWEFGPFDKSRIE